MYIFIIRRILFFIPALFFVVLLSFILLHYSPGDPVERLLTSQGAYDELTPSSADQQYRRELTQKLGLDLPLFYFSVSAIDESGTGWKKYIPKISFHKSNQFNRWLFGDSKFTSGIINGDLGISWITFQPVSSIIFSGIKWSVLLTLLSVLLAYVISLPAGLWAARYPHSPGNRLFAIFTTILFSLPVFWVSTLLMMLLCNPGVINILPSSGIAPLEGFPENSSFMQKVFLSIPYLILPTICYTYSSLAFLTRSIKTSVTDILKEDFIRTARAKGLSETRIITKHALRNALLPMITIFSQVFPLAIGGSVILETIFTIPGMGLAIYNSIYTQDYPVIIGVFLVTGVVTMIAFLLSDILYVIADPRISFSEKQK